MQIYLNNEAKTKIELPQEYQAIVNAANSAIDACPDFLKDCEKENAKRATTVKFLNISQPHSCLIETNKNTVILAIKDKLQNVLKYQIPDFEGKISFDITQKIKDTLAELPVGTPPSKSTWKRKKPETAKKPITYPGNRDRQTSLATAPVNNTSTSSTTQNSDTISNTSAQIANQSTTSTPRSKPIAIPRRRSSITDIAHPSTPPQPPAATSSNIKQTPILQTTITAITPPTSTSTSSCSNASSSAQGKTAKKAAVSSVASDNQSSKNIAKSTPTKQKDHSNNDKKRGSKPITQHNEDSKETTTLLPKQSYKKSKHHRHHRRHHHKTKLRTTETFDKQKIVIVPSEHHNKTKPQNPEITKQNPVVQYFDAIPESEYVPQPKKQTPKIEERIQKIEQKIDSITSSSCWCCFFGKTKEIKALQENKKNLEILLQTTIN